MLKPQIGVQYIYRYIDKPNNEVQYFMIKSQYVITSVECRYQFVSIKLYMPRVTKVHVQDQVHI